jgi:Zn-finger domain-containing protein
VSKTDQSFDPFAPDDLPSKWDKTKVWRKPAGVSLSVAYSFRTTEQQMGILSSIVRHFPDRYKDIAEVIRTAIINQALVEQEIAKNPPAEYLREQHAYQVMVESDRLQAERDRHKAALARIEKNAEDAKGSPEERIDAIVDCEKIIETLTYPRFVEDARGIMIVGKLL